MARLSLCLAVLAVFAASVAASGDLSILADIHGKGAATMAAPAVAGATPSTPPEAAATAATDVKQITLPTKQMPSFQMPTMQMPTMQMPTIELPTITKEDAPCVNKCSSQCTVSLQKSCKMVPTTTKECATVTKPTTTQKCYKKCSVNIPVIAPASTPAMAASGNPSAPAPAADAPAAAAMASSSDSSASGMAMSMPDLHGKGLSAIQSLLGMHSSKPSVSCAEVTCEDVPSSSIALECNDVTKDVEQCSLMPAKDCKEVCTCVPMKTVTVTLPSHSFNKMGLDKKMMG